jgi:hypothetical protein
MRVHHQSMNSNQSIAELAYQLWSSRGRPHGSEEEDWLEAERQLSARAEANGSASGRDCAVDTSLKESFPASDPAASHLPDLPPSNAADKWIAAGKAPRTTSIPTLSRASAPRPAAQTIIAASEARDPPVDETDDVPNTAPHDIGEG